jgi:hypothetical protein
MSLLRCAAAAVNRRGKPTSVADAMRYLRTFNRTQVAHALRAAKAEGLIVQLRVGDQSTPALYGPKDHA